MAPLLFCAVDLGAESGRVVTGHFDGEKLALEAVHRFANTPVRVAGTLYWDVLRLWSDIQDGLAKVGASGAEVAGIGVDTWGVDFGLLDENDQLIGNPLHYRNWKATGIDRAAQVVPREEIYQRTGLQFLPFNTLYPLLQLKEQKSPALEIARSLLFIPDLLHFWLCGAKKNEYSIASTSQMLHASQRLWDEDLLRRFDLPTNLLGELVVPGSTLGSLRKDVATRLRLSEKTPVIAPASHDTGSAVASVPFEPGVKAAYLSSGTWSLMGLELDEPLISPRSYELGFTNEGGFGNTIRFLKNIAGLWLVQECRRTWLREGQEFNYAQLTQMASEAAENGPFVEPDDARFAAPFSMPDEVRAYCRETGQHEPNSIGEVVRCCLDSLVLKYRWTFERLEELGGQNLDILYIVGGGTQNKLLCQLTADCLGKTVVAGPVEATAAGNILAQAMARGAVHDLAQMRQVVRASFETHTYEPHAATKSQWDEKFARFEALDR